MPSWQLMLLAGGRAFEWLAPSLRAVDTPTPSGCGALRLTGAGRKRLQEGEVRALEKELPVTSEEALNEMVKQIEYRISHEQVPLAEEKLLVRVHCVAVERVGGRGGTAFLVSPLACASSSSSAAPHAGRT